MQKRMNVAPPDIFSEIEGYSDVSRLITEEVFKAFLAIVLFFV